MRLTKLFTKTRKEVPADEAAHNAKLLIQAGFVHKVMAGVYAYTPLGLRVLENIKQIIREEMNTIGGQELIMTSLQPKELWERTGRWDDKTVDVWFKSKLQDDTEVGFAWSHEEPIMDMLSEYVVSYKDLPVSVYQFQTKMRNELRAKSGIMRGREFLMKDLYSLHATEEDMNKYYDKVSQAYSRIFDRLGIGDETFVTFAAGGAFTKYSHEFQTICDAGEDVLYISKDKKVAVNEEVLQDASKEIGIDKSELTPVKSAEVGNIFKFGTEKARSMGITYTDKAGNQQPIYLASYGIGVTRVMGVIAEKMCDDRGLVWPENIAPAQVYIARLGDDEEVVKVADNLYEELQKAGIETLYDDRDVRPGEKFADADLIGIPHRVVVSPKTVKEDLFEHKKRTNKDAKLVNKKELFKTLACE
ncbi:prolyl-tRNA synthetase [Candidatus Saccharibacteria bacterium]|nr:prolyl-tRNA synthetase [Candidatus Saccharibacteria bacterium]